MNKKGFVTSALLYGILSLFFVLILGTLSIISNRKLASDRLKESALADVQNLDTDISCFDIDNCIISYYDYDKCEKDVYIGKKVIGNCPELSISDGVFESGTTVYYKANHVNINENLFYGVKFIKY